MALSTGAKIAIGCVVAVVVSVGAVTAVVVGLAWWGIHKAQKAVEQLEADQKATEEALNRANANAFTAPDDGLLKEDRLLRFLAVRKALHDEVYLKHKPMIDAQAQKQAPDLGALTKLPFIISELRACKARALAEQAMSESEFTWHYEVVYGGLLLRSIGGGDGVSEMARSVHRDAIVQAEKAATEAEADPNVSPDVKRQLREAVNQAREEAKAAGDMAAALDLLPANVELLKKHREEVLKYTMGGLELIPF